MTKEEIKKPPLGLIPKEFWIQTRISAIDQAMKRYENINMNIPIEWITELNELVIKRKQLKPLKPLNNGSTS